MPKLLMIIAQRGFQETEYSVPRDIFEKSGFQVYVASLSKELAIGSKGKEIQVDFRLDNVRGLEYDAIVLVGGPGATVFQRDHEVTRILVEAREKGALIAAICIAPTILAIAGLLNGKKATVWNGDGNQDKVLGEGGAKYVNEDVVVDDGYVTASGPHAAEEFGNRIVNLIN